MKLADKVKLYLRKSGLTQEQFAHLCGWEQGRLNHYMHQRRQLKLEIIQIIADAMKNTDPSWLAFDTNPPDWALEITPIQINTWDDIKLVDLDALKGHYELPVNGHGHGMEHPYDPRQSFTSNQIIKVDPFKTPFNGVFVVALLKTGQTVIRKYFDEAGHKELQAFKAPPISLDQVEKICGVIIEKTEKMLPVET